MPEREDIAPFVAWMARLGLGARAFVYLAVAGILLYAASTGKPDEGVSPSDAFKFLENQTGGRVLLLAIGLGLFLYSLWRFQQAILDPDNQGRDAKGIMARIGMAMSGVSYLLIGVAAIAVTFGQNQSGSGGGTTQEAARWMVDKPFGQTVIILFGILMIVIGFVQVWRAWQGQWKKKLDLSGWPQKLTGIVAFGISARGILFVVLGGFIVIGGWQASPDSVKGLAGTLSWLRAQPFGLWLFIGSALAIGSYGIYSSIQSLRYRFPDA